jgi:lipoprotein-anchoring transpeptidase ErfK/SrfK
MAKAPKPETDSKGADKAADTADTTPAVMIQSRPVSFWRCGTQFTQTPVIYPAGHFTAEELDVLRLEKNLTVTIPAEDQAVIEASLEKLAAGEPVALGGASDTGTSSGTTE